MTFKIPSHMHFRVHRTRSVCNTESRRRQETEVDTKLRAEEDEEGQKTRSKTAVFQWVGVDLGYMLGFLYL